MNGGLSDLRAQWIFHQAAQRKPLGSDTSPNQTGPLNRWRGQSPQTLSQRAQIIRHVAELPDHYGIAKMARSGVTRAAKSDRADMTFLA